MKTKLTLALKIPLFTEGKKQKEEKKFKFSSENAIKSMKFKIIKPPKIKSLNLPHY